MSKLITIPEITNPLGKHWIQPKTSEILVDTDVAVMTKETCDKLYEYSTSTPTGIYVGKMWKSRFNGKLYLRFIVPAFKPESGYIETREILILN